MRAFLSLIFALGFFVAAGAVGGYFYLQSWADSLIAVSEPQVINFPSGTSLDALSGHLEDKGVVSNKQVFKVYVKSRGVYGRFQAGNYRFEGSVSPFQVVQAITEGKTWVPIALQVTIPEGWNLKQIAGRLAEGKIGSREELLTLAKDPQFLSSLKIAGPTLEGYVYPATYTFAKMPTAKDFYTKAVQTFWEKLPPGYKERCKAKNLTLSQAVTFASLIELETAAVEEKSMVSEVIWRRLKDGSPLGIDAALIYGIPDYQGDILWRHLKDRTNPYNTRIHHGLPPTAIGSVSASSLEAVLTPTNTGAYYYVLDLSGPKPHHHFSKTLKEHQTYVKKLVQTLNARKSANSGAELKNVNVPEPSPEGGVAP